MRNAQKMSASIGQQDAVITFDLAIYMKAKQIQWKASPEFENAVIRMGGFHIAINFLSVIGKIYAESGLEDLLVESGVYAAGSTSALLAGKQYNRGVRAHKLVVEAFFRLSWKAFEKWLLERPIEEQPRQFKQESRTKSSLFAFWDDYCTIVNILLQFIKAERTGKVISDCICFVFTCNVFLSFAFHIQVTGAYIWLPQRRCCRTSFSMDRQNYARWIPVYLADMKELPRKHPKSIKSNHAISRSDNQPFAKVWTDMALEQSINADSKSKGGVVGITHNQSALQRWF
ncbi:unnamed protein product [Porites lobata]|uniref:Uncharacterized protein n=1 Tax=Porites lobata TaxID=104759 RepID=A0ABN8QCK0_9CNID|nr:unnamed protein product [Porites lobata]